VTGEEGSAARRPEPQDDVPWSGTDGYLEGVVPAPWVGFLRRLLLIGRVGWALVGMTVAVVAVGLLLGRLRLVVVPVVLALFPATLLAPVAAGLKRWRLPDAVAAGAALVAGLTVIGAIIGLMVPLVVAEAPRLAETAGAGVAEVERFLTDGPFGLDLGGVAGLVERAREQLGDVATLAGPAFDAATAAFEMVIGVLLMLVVLFFFLKDGERISRGLVAAAPEHLRPRLHQVGKQAWGTLGAFLWGQLLIALVDAVAIGIGLALLRVPLALPLAVLIFFGGLFPIVGAVTAGALAVLVALAHGGLALGLGTLVLVVAVQQLEGNVLEPLILSHVVRLQPLVVVLAVTSGAITFGVLGAFLAVPVVAVVVHVIGDLREEAGRIGPESPERAPPRDEPSDHEPPQPEISGGGSAEQAQDRP
jgi:putative heme transporter